MGSDQWLASYTTPPAGTYTFRVRGATSRAAWSEPGAVLAFNIIPAFCQTNWFILVCIAAAGGLVWAAYRWRVGVMAAHLDRLRTTIDSIPAFAWVCGTVPPRC